MGKRKRFQPPKVGTGSPFTPGQLPERRLRIYRSAVVAFAGDRPLATFMGQGGSIEVRDVPSATRYRGSVLAGWPDQKPTEIVADGRTARAAAENAWARARRVLAK